MPPSPVSTASEKDLLQAAQGGDEQAFEQLVTPYRGELTAHCYRMLASMHDAEDVLQETLLRAWKALPRFEGRSSLRSWLYTIATNTSLNAIERRPKQRVLPLDYAPATDPHVGPGEPIAESVWIEPFPDDQIGLEDGYAAPEARYELREGVELAFVAALQHLPANQRAVLILREVLGYSAKETAAMLETSIASVNSALQRARAAVEERVPEQTQQQTLRDLGAEERELLERYVAAWESNDIETFASMLAEDASFSMPPLASWYRGREAIRQWAEGWPLSGAWRWKTRLVRANGQPAIGFYTWDEAASAYLPFALNVVTFQGREIADVTAFVARSIEPTEREAYERWPDQPADPDRLAGTFERFGLPDRLE